MSKGGKFLKFLLSMGEYNRVILYYWLSSWRKLATVKSFKAVVSSVAPRQSEVVLTKGSDKGLTLETSALKLLTEANLRYQFSW